ncbi:hypothetical protein ACE1SV_00150 [Streptomyces sp. E-15]
MKVGGALGRAVREHEVDQAGALWGRSAGQNFGSAAHPAGRPGLSTGTVSIGSGSDQVMP